MSSTNKLAPIPHPPKKPVVGNMLSLDANAPVQDLARLAKELGPIFWLDMMGSPIVIVGGHDLVDELSDEKRFDKAVRGALRRVRAVGGDGLFTADTKEPNWTKAHNILLQPFGNRAMQSYHPSMVDIAEQLVKKWERLNTDEEIDVVHDMTALTLDTIGLCGFDYRFNSFYRSDYHPFVESLVRSLETIMMTRGLPLESLWMQRRRRDLAGDVAFMNSMVDEIIAERRKAAEAADGKKDMLAAMMTGVDRATGEQLDDVNIRYQINTFLIAGHETTSGLLSCAIYAMLKHPEVLKKAYEEVDRVFGPDVNAKPTYQQVTQLHYITQILKESLRLWPPAPAYGIAPVQDETIGGGKYKLRKGTFVTILVLALHRDPSVWGPNPDAFDPENFSKEAEAARPINAWKPFGNGQRACIGRGFAMHEAALALGMILQRFKMTDHKRYQMVLKETLTIKPDGFKIKVRPRHDHERGAYAGRTNVATSAAAPLAPVATGRARPSHNTPLLVLYGSNLGTAEELATRVADLAEVNGFATKLAPLDEFVGKLPTEGGVLIFCASYNGAAPDNATQFVNWLGTDLPKDAFAKVRYAVFGCGNSDWLATYQSIPRIIDDQLRAHGATNAYVRGEGDARDDLDGQFEDWFAKLRPLAVKEFGLDTGFERSADDAPLYQIEPVAPSAVNTVVALGGVVPMKVLGNRELQNGASDRSTRHIEIELPAGTSYRVGDHLSVVPRNDPALVDAVARRFGFLPDDQIRLQVAEGRRAQLPVGDVVSVGRLLTEFVELQQVATRKQIQIMAENTRCPMTKPKLLGYVGDDPAASERYRSDILAKRESVFDLLEEHPACELPFHTYLEMLSLLAPRYYSISSSPQGETSRCSVTTAVVQGPAHSGRGIYKGVCSNYLSGRRAGDTVHAIVRETKAGFRLPDDPLVPLLMIGPGTGLAPFRGFLQERAARKAQGAVLGPALLFFGCRHPDQDFLYAEELKGFAGDGICELHTAFSRGDAPKTYVQHLITQQKDRVWDLIQQGAITYVCGDGGKMEPDVKAALMAIQRERSGGDDAAALTWIDDLGTRNRYVLDVWAGS
jgi:cytochrome P450/NADPH-cytochrome P450 reductase